jgi:hypothetical protein
MIGIAPVLAAARRGDRYRAFPAPILRCLAPDRRLWFHHADGMKENEMFHLIATTAGAAPPVVPLAAASATPLAAPAASVALPGQAVSPADVAAYIDPRDIAAFLPAPPPTTELVAVSDGFFRLLENATLVALFVVGFFLLARLLHAWMLHRSIRRALEAKSDHLGAMIDKLNKPYEHLGPRGSADTPGDDRNGLVLLAIGLAMAGFGLIQGQEQMIRIATGAALFPAFVGIALLVRRRLARVAAAEERAAARG